MNDKNMEDVTYLSPQVEYCSILDQQKFQSNPQEPFTIAFNLSFVEQNELIIEFPEENLLRLGVHHSIRNVGRFEMGRDCVYLYRLPARIQKHNLVALWTADNYLIIKEASKELETEVSSSEDNAPGKSTELELDSSNNVISENQGHLVDENNRESLVGENVFQLIPKKSEKVLKPLVTEFELMQYMKDIEKQMMEVRKIIEQTLVKK